jgi:hypothetical protein
VPPRSPRDAPRGGDLAAGPIALRLGELAAEAARPAFAAAYGFCKAAHNSLAEHVDDSLRLPPTGETTRQRMIETCLGRVAALSP